MSTYQPASATTLDQSSDAAYRLWVAELLNAFTNGNWSLGHAAFTTFQQAADTGQITSTILSTATRPAINTAGGYIILKFTDTNAAACPIWIKVEIGSGAATTSPSLWVTVGTQTDGAGTVGGTILQARTQYTAAPLNTTTTRPTYSSAGDGYFIIVFKNQGWSATGNTFFMFFCRGYDETLGTATADGYTFGISVANSVVVARHVNANGGTGPTAIGTNDQATYCTIIAALTASLVGGIPQAFKWFGAFPKVEALLPLCSVLQTEVATTTQFPAILAGATSHNYLSLQLGGAQLPNLNALAGYNVGMIWE